MTKGKPREASDAAGRGFAERWGQAGIGRFGFGVWFWQCGADSQAVAHRRPEVAEERRQEDSKRCQGERLRDTEAP